MKTLTVRLPDVLAADIEAESEQRGVSMSDIVRARLQAPLEGRRGTKGGLNRIADLIGAVEGLPSDLSAEKKRYLDTTGYGRKHRR